jgi:hypothetical protein
MDHLRYCDGDPHDNKAYQQYLEDMRWAKTLLRQAVLNEIAQSIRQRSSARSFTAVMTPVGMFDEIVCNISYYFNKQGSKYFSITRMTEAAKQHFATNRARAVLNAQGLLRFPDGRTYETDGRIVTSVS